MELIKIDSKKALLLLLYLPLNNENERSVKGNTRLQKMMFIFEKEIYPILKPSLYYEQPEFFAFDYGPFSSQVLDDLQFFINIKFIIEKDLNYNSNYDEAYNYEMYEYGDYEYSKKISDKSYIEYSLSNKGIEFVKNKISPLFNTEQLNLLSEFKIKINNTPLKAILKYVYQKYPDMTGKSKIKDIII